MTEKQEKILQAALELFANEGFHATPTSKVAKAAGVSEGLIFRHFKNKEGLMQAILNEGESRVKELFFEIVMEPDPKEVIRKSITLVTKVDVADYNFWKLQFKLKWELEISGEKKMEPLRMALVNAFQKLGYESPQLEAQLIILYIDGISSFVLKGSELDTDKMIQFMLSKYDL